MHIGSTNTKWLFRRLRAEINRVLCRLFDIETVKAWNTKLLYHRNIDVKHPLKLNEVFLWLEYHTDSPQRSRLTDKYEVRSYVSARGHSEALIPLIGLYENADEVNFDKLPEQFVLKATHGCDMNYICRDKQSLDVPATRKMLTRWLKTDLAYISLEPHYASINPRILCEQFLGGEGDMIDYKFFCCNGKAQFVEVCSERSKGPYLNVFDLDWNEYPDVIVGATRNPREIPRPHNLEKMIQLANDLATGIPAVRVDLYNVNEHIYFGEMTFTPATGVLFHFSEDFLLEQGKRFSNVVH